MKCILFFLVLFTLLDAKPNEIRLYEASCGPETYEWWVTEAQLKNTPRWQRDQENLPLSVKVAVDTAFVWFEKNNIHDPKLRRVCICNFSHAGRDFEGCYYYVILVSSGTLESMACVVLLDGSTVNRRIKGFK